MGLRHLAVVILQNVGSVAVQHAGAAALDGRGVFAAVHAFTGGFHANEAGILKGDVGVKNTHRVTSAPHTGNDCVGLLVNCIELGQHARHLGNALGADHALKVAHHHGVGVRAGNGTNDVKSIVHIGDPVAHGFIQSIFEGSAATFDGNHGRT